MESKWKLNLIDGKSYIILTDEANVKIFSEMLFGKSSEIVKVNELKLDKITHGENLKKDFDLSVDAQPYILVPSNKIVSIEFLGLN